MHRFTNTCLLTVFLCLGTTVFANALSFEERVACQRAIEDVYWRHTIWPTENSEPKPALHTIITDREIRLKVENYLRKSNALAEYFYKPITKEKIQSEIDRIANETKDPQVLRELFAALRNDPYLIAECLVRPILVDRLTRQINGFEQWWAHRHGSVDILSEVPAGGYHLPEIKAGVAFDPYSAEMTTANSWTATSTSGAPDARAAHTAVWTGTQMIVWGGGFNTGGRYTPSTDTWSATSTTGAPSPRGNNTAVWTGKQMIIWGGCSCPGHFFKTGGRYTPSTDTWAATNTTGAPSGRYAFTAIWTGKQMIIWGGYTSAAGVTNTGGRYNPSTNTWKATSTTGAPSARQDHTAVWTSTQMIVWGGENTSGSFKTGGRYTPSSNTWTATSITGAPSARITQTAVWTGTQMVIWGGLSFGVNGVVLNTGGRYKPSTNTWTAITKTGAPSARYWHSGVWTGTEMIIWGGRDGAFFNTGGLYTP